MQRLCISGAVSVARRSSGDNVGVLMVSFWRVLVVGRWCSGALLGPLCALLCCAGVFIRVAAVSRSCRVRIVLVVGVVLSCRRGDESLMLWRPVGVVLVSHWEILGAGLVSGSGSRLVVEVVELGLVLVF